MNVWSDPVSKRATQPNYTKAGPLCVLIFVVNKASAFVSTPPVRHAVCVPVAAMVPVSGYTSGAALSTVFRFDFSVKVGGGAWVTQKYERPVDY